MIRTANYPNPYSVLLIFLSASENPRTRRQA